MSTLDLEVLLYGSGCGLEKTRLTKKENGKRRGWIPDSTLNYKLFLFLWGVFGCYYYIPKKFVAVSSKSKELFFRLGNHIIDRVFVMKEERMVMKALKNRFYLNQWQLISVGMFWFVYDKTVDLFMMYLSYHNMIEIFLVLNEMQFIVKSMMSLFLDKWIFDKLRLATQIRSVKSYDKMDQNLSPIMMSDFLEAKGVIMSVLENVRVNLIFAVFDKAVLCFQVYFLVISVNSPLALFLCTCALVIHQLVTRNYNRKTSQLSEQYGTKFQKYNSARTTTCAMVDAGEVDTKHYVSWLTHMITIYSELKIRWRAKTIFLDFLMYANIFIIYCVSNYSHPGQIKLHFIFMQSYLLSSSLKIINSIITKDNSSSYKVKLETTLKLLNKHKGLEEMGNGCLVKDIWLKNPVSFQFNDISFCGCVYEWMATNRFRKQFVVEKCHRKNRTETLPWMNGSANKKSLRDKIHLPLGSRVLIIGDSGSGKSTLCNILSGKRSSPDLVLDDFTRVNYSGGLVLDNFNESMKKSCSWIGEGASSSICVNKMTVSDLFFIETPFKGEPDSEELETMDEILEICKLKEFAQKTATEERSEMTFPSSGEKNRIHLACRLNQIRSENTSIVIWDEGDKGLSEDMFMDILEGVNSFLGKKQTLVLVSHCEIAKTLVNWDYVVKMEKGEIHYDSKKDD